MATTTKSKTTKAKVQPKAKASAKVKAPTSVPTSTKAPREGATTVIAKLLADAHPTTPSEADLVKLLEKQGVFASPSTIKTVREHTKRALKILDELGRLKQ